MRVSLHYLNIAILISSLILPLVSCSSSENDDEPTSQKPKVELVRQSIQESSTIDPYTVNILELEYNKLVQIVPEKDITLNGKKANATAKGMKVTIDLNLERWQQYTLQIPEGAISHIGDADNPAPALTIHFDTKYGKDPADKSQISVNLINPKASKETKQLYETLKSGYGKTMLSGAMGGIGWETTYTDLIYKENGVYPAIVGFDYLHLAWSPANWIDYGDITPVKTIYDRGCIPEIGWHWNVPRKEGSTDITSDANTDFKPANIMVEGTWENKVATADIEKLAGYLRLLQDAGIPVLWRPLHEAAGDYTWGAWFWWGKQGTDVTKQLWCYLYDQLTNTYGLNNLIWVWTVQTTTGGITAALATMQAAYPGDDYVDIVGCDIYPNEILTDQSAQFDIVNQVVDGHKIVALTEVGNLIDPSKAKANEALWCYFMQWYDYENGQYGHYNWDGKSWGTVLASPYVTSVK